MARFDVLVRRLDGVEPHPNADRLDLAVVGGYRAVVARGQFQRGDLVAYIPEAAVLPDSLIAQLGLAGKLAGPAANRVHAVRLRGALSQGVVVAARPGWEEGQSVMAELGVSKFEPDIPAELRGAVYPLEREEGLSFDIENIKAFPGLFAEGEDVVMTEKIHGVFLAVGAAPARLARPGCGHVRDLAWVSSKGLLGDRLAFRTDGEGTANVYVRAAQAAGLLDKAMALAQARDAVVLVLGEAFGTGVQDLGYGRPGGAPAFRAFAVVVDGAFLDEAALECVLVELGIARVPVLYRGPFSQETMLSMTQGRETISGQACHLREGVVITPVAERQDPRIGRVVAKSVSEAYLLRKGGTEYT